MVFVEEEARKELGELFHGAVTDHMDVMAECKFLQSPSEAGWKATSIGLSIIRLYNIPPSSLYYKYEAFLLSRPSGLRAKLSILTLDTVRELRKEIQRERQVHALAGINGTPGGLAAEKTPKGGVGVRKGKANMGDLSGLYVERLWTIS